MTVALTVLALSGMGVPPYSARGLGQSFQPIQQAAQPRRTVNGKLVNVSDDSFEKFATTISGADQRPPACDGVWPGKVVTVDCIFHLCYLTAGGSPSRTVVAGSSFIEGDFTFYRPQLQCMVISYSCTEDEWEAGNNWSLQLEEI
jgi:hypothetical protein